MTIVYLPIKKLHTKICRFCLQCGKLISKARDKEIFDSHINSQIGQQFLFRTKLSSLQRDKKKLWHGLVFFQKKVLATGKCLIAQTPYLLFGFPKQNLKKLIINSIAILFLKLFLFEILNSNYTCRKTFCY